MAKGKHLGSFAGGFMEGLLGVMKMQMMQMHYAALQKHYDALDDHYKRAEAFERFKYLHGEEYGKWEAGQQGAANFDKAPVKGEDEAIRDHIIQHAQQLGKDPDQALAIWRQESAGGQHMTGDVGPNGQPSSFGDLQFHFGGINSDMPNAGMGDDFLRDTGIDMRKPENYNNPETRMKAIDYALDSASKNGWGAWAKSVQATGVPVAWGNTGQGGGATPKLVDATGIVNATGGANATSLHPAFANRVAELSKQAEAATGEKLSFNELYRTHEQQAAIRASHEKMEGGVTAHPAAPEYQSNHEYGAAGDANPNKAFNWAITPDANGVTPLERVGLERLPGEVGKNDPYHIQLPKRDWGKSAQADTAGSYRVAGLAPIGLTREGAERAREDLEAHRYKGPQDDRVFHPENIFTGGVGKSLGHVPLVPSPEPNVSPYRDAADPSEAINKGPPQVPGTDVTSGEPTGVHLPPPAPIDPYGPSPEIQSFERPSTTPPTYDPRQGPGGPNPNDAPNRIAPIDPYTLRGPNYVDYPLSSTYSPGGGQRAPAIPIGGGAGNVMEAPSGTPAANAPAPNAQPAVALRPEPQATPAQPGWGLIDRPNMDAISGPYHTGRGPSGGPAQMGAFDFSTLWKPNPPIAQRGATPAPQPAQAQRTPPNTIISTQQPTAGQAVTPPQPPPRPTAVVIAPPPIPSTGVKPVPTPSPRPVDATPANSVPPAPGSGDERMISMRDEQAEDQLASQDEADTQMAMAPAIPSGPEDMMAVGARKGGPIRSRRRYAAGGNVTRFATGGAAPTAAQLADPGWQNTPSTYTLPGNAPFTNQQVYNLSQTINSSPQPFLSPLSPSGSKDLTGFYGAYTPPASTPAAPAPLNEPAPSVAAVSTPTLTSTANNAANGGTTTGAYQLPDIVAPATTPTVNKPSTTFNPTPRTPSTLVPNAPGGGASDIGGTNFKQPSTLNTGAYAGFRRGGAIPRRATLGRYATGGQVTRFATGGAAPLLGTPVASMMDLNNGSYVGPTVGGGWTGTPYAQLAPNQQAWANQQSAAIAAIPSYNPNDPASVAQEAATFTQMPTAIWSTAAAPAAPAPLNEPAPSVTAVSTPTLTSTANNAANGGTTTGAYQLPNIVAPATTPTVNKPSTTYNTTPKIPSTLVPNAPGGNASDIGGTNFNKPGAMSTGAYAGFRRGGAIPRRATLTKFAAAGSVTSSQEEAALQQAIGYGPTSTVASLQASYNAMTPEQQAWYTSQNAALQGYLGAGQAAGASYTPPTGERGGQGPTVNQGQLALATGQKELFQSQFNPNEPAAQAAAAAAAASPATSAPAPAIPPTVTAISTPTLTSTLNNAANGGTTTGAYQLPNIVAPANTPKVNTPTTTYNPTPKIPTTLVPNTPNTGASDIGATDTSKKPTTAGDASMNTGAYAGFRRGGVTRRVNRYDDGGGVSPAPAGMLPGLGGGQSIPPIYYNPATYAGAGAPVGKGVTNTSAPTYVAGAIPTLPVAKGGIVRYADGGGVGDEDMVDASGDVGDDDYAQAGGMGSQYAMNADPVASARSGVEPSAAGYISSPPEQAQQQQQQPGPPPGAPAWTPQVNDGQGNPSRGLIGAIAGGLHFLGGGTGLGGSQQGALASDPGVQTARQNFASGRQLDGQPLPTKDEYMHDIPEAIGADGLHEGLKHLASMEAIHNFYLYRGETEKADQMTAAMMQVSVGLARDFGKEAVSRYYNGDLKGAVDAMNNSKDVIADGTIVKATVNPDGKSVSVAGKNLNGEDLWRQVVAPQAILGAALHTADGSLPWHMYEITAAKYDQRSHDMIAARTQAGQTDQANAEIAKFGPANVQRARDWGAGSGPPRLTPTGVAPVPAAPQPAQPSTITAQGAPGIPGLTPPPNVSPIQDVAGGAPGADRRTPAQPPAGADQAGGTQPALTLAPTPAISGPPTREAGQAADALASRDAQEVAMLSPETERANKEQMRQDAHANNWTPEGHPFINGQESMPPQPMDEATFNKLAPQVQNVWKQRDAQYREDVKFATQQENNEYTSKAGDYTTWLNGERERRGNIEKEKIISQREGFTQSQLTARQTGQQTFETNKEDSARKYAAIRPLTDQDISGERKDADGNDTITQGVYNALLTPDENAAIAQKRYNPMDLLGQKGYSQSDVNTMYQAVYNARRYTHDITIPNASELIGGLVSGAYKTDGPATPLGDGGDGVKRAMLTIVRPDGTSQHLALPENDAQSVARLWANKDAVRQQERTKQTRYDIDQGNAAINRQAAENAAAYQASQPPAAQDRFATPAPSQPFLNKPSYPPQPAMPPAPRPNDPYAPNAPPPGVGQGYRIW